MKTTPEIARIHAHICGDGYVMIAKERRSPSDLLTHKRRKIEMTVWTMAYCNTSKELIKEFQDDMKITFNRSGYYRRNKYEVRLRAAKHIIKFLQLENKNSRNWVIPDFVLESSDKIIKNWIRAFFDDEATVDIKKRAIFVTSVNRNGLIQVSNTLMKLGINSKVNGPYYDAWRLCIRSNNTLEYSKKISFLHKEKLEKLNIIKMGRGGVS